VIGNVKAMQKPKPFFKLETKRFTHPTNFHLWCWKVILRFVLFAGYPVVLVGACRTGKSLLLSKLTPGYAFDSERARREAGRLVVNESDIPSGTFSIDECQVVEPQSLKELMRKLAENKRTFCLSLQRYSVVKYAVDVYRSNEKAKRVVLVVVGGKENSMTILEELPKVNWIPAWVLWLRCVLVRGGHLYSRWWWEDRVEAGSYCEECADMRTPKNRHTWLHRDRIHQTRPVFLGTSDGLWNGSVELLPVWRKGRSPIADALAATGTKPGEKYIIDKHYVDGNGIWHPVVLDPMGESSEFSEQWIVEQNAEEKLLIALGETLSY
jgi:hypothetical protein